MSPSQSLLEYGADFKLMSHESQSMFLKRVKFPDYTREPWDVDAMESSGRFVLCYEVEVGRINKKSLKSNRGIAISKVVR